MAQCKIFANKLTIQFLLREHPEYFTLENLLYADGKKLTASIRKDPLFVVDTVKDHFYLVSSMQDENLLNFFDKSKNRVTVLKIHFSDFYNRFLSKMVVCYPVFYSQYKTKRQVPFELATVMKDVRFKGLEN